MNVKRILANAFCVFLAAGVGTGMARADDIKVLSPVALKPVIEAVSAEFEQSTGQKLAVTWSESGAIKADIEKGVPFDVAIITPNFVDDLVKEGKLDRANVMPVARSGLGIAIRKGAPKPDVSTVEAFKQTLLNAKSIGFAEHSASSRYLSDLLDKLQIADAVKSKLKPLPGAVYSYLANGDAEIAVTQIAAVVPFAGIELAGPLPAEIQRYTVFVAAVSPASRAAADSRTLLKILTSSGVAAILSKTGLEAPTR